LNLSKEKVEGTKNGPFSYTITFFAVQSM
jgi:hypothetical protein